MSPAEQVRTELFGALVPLRAVLTLYAVFLNLVRLDELARPVLAVAELVVMVAWSAYASWAYGAPQGRRLPLYLADLGVALVLVLSTPVVQSQPMLDRHAATMPSFWVIAAVLAWAVGRGLPQALAAAGAVAVCDLAVRTVTAGSTWGNIFLLFLAAGVVGYTSQQLREAAELRAVLQQQAAVQAERIRLSRVVHDGVLQVLALVQRRGHDPGPNPVAELRDLGRLAGEQEQALRALVQQDARSLSTTDRGQVDLMALLQPLGGPGVVLSGPGRAVPLPPGTAAELVSAVGACLDNVSAHVGARATAWVLVEDLGGEVLVSVRDEGPGIGEGRLVQAEREGRLGVAGSIRGRIKDLGGRAALTSQPGRGTEWELTVPRSGPS